MSHPKTYSAYAFTEKGGTLQKLIIDWQDPKDGEIVVKVLACGVCGSDEFVETGALGMQYPHVPGHEIVGEIVAVPPNEKNYKVGQRVGGAWHGQHCFSCTPCRSGDFTLCEHTEANGIHRDGGYAEYATLRSEAVVNVPTDIDPAEAAPLLCAGVTVFNALRNMSYVPGDLVAIQGIGGLGHLAIRFARKMGLRPVAISTSADKKDVASRLGAVAYLDSSKLDIGKALTEMGGAKIIVVTANNPDVLNNFIEGLSIGGTLLILSFPPTTPINLVPLIFKRASLRGWPAGDPKACEDTIAFAQSAGIRSLVTTFPLDKAQEAYEFRSKARFRAVIVPNA
ncbi:unnamed protein product [Somion occarium]|uniref:Enoyl reductase (ER) domain-containing protein n=1 Tax=Somion occarium TaxID=3059160 RepID=A0ABP1DT42_9APHY